MQQILAMLQKMGEKQEKLAAQVSSLWYPSCPNEDGLHRQMRADACERALLISGRCARRRSSSIGQLPSTRVSSDFFPSTFRSNPLPPCRKRHRLIQSPIPYRERDGYHTLWSSREPLFTRSRPCIPQLAQIRRC